MPFSSRDTIAATATAPGRGGVAIIRISGSEAFSIAERLSGRVPRAGRISFDQYRIDGRLLDEGVTLAFRGPHSYTGEDVVELQCHGGSVVPRRVLEACLASGARLARRGEFTERAFLNGRLTYEEAESVLDLVDAKTDRGADAALRGLAGERRREIRGIYDALVDLSSTAEHALDVSEEELPDGFCAALLAKAESIAARLDEAIRRAKEGKMLREGALVVISGPPNAGKSSLMNALLGEARTIVSETPGTTRDSIEEWLDIGGWPVRLVDTAGLREAEDAVEGEGIARARDLIVKADIVLNLTPADANRESPVARHPSPSTRTIEVFSKCDLAANSEDFGVISVSAKTGEGLDALRGAIAAELERKAAEPGEAEGGLGCDAAALIEARSLLSPTPRPRPFRKLRPRGFRASRRSRGRHLFSRSSRCALLEILRRKVT
ncbi:MAG: tRNA uridine-5-carboxymethylaminomethyl(34) synthesis GTPase MnmE [Kiritimatiellae bacterium]|nr:tRNA uridine-5-carboxymethylaminomethyl(34) synthesis GTPase MnmE [Kiritimatiellia bacterium]